MLIATLSTIVLFPYFNLPDVLFDLVVPILNLALGSNFDPEDIREGGDVFFECKIHANPWVYKVVWLHNVSEFSVMYKEEEEPEKCESLFSQQNWLLLA